MFCETQTTFKLIIWADILYFTIKLDDQENGYVMGEEYYITNVEFLNVLVQDKFVWLFTTDYYIIFLVLKPIPID